MRSVLVMAASAAGCFPAPSFEPGQVIIRVPVEGSNYCRLWFPAIREDTLFSERPQLKDPKDGDLIYLLGPCDHDPLGAGEVQRQREDAKRDQRREYR
jgi:hypothetical protein